MGNQNSITQNNKKTKTIFPDTCRGGDIGGQGGGGGGGGGGA